ncbi:MAG TPA: AIPR family protein [Capsulimonadaceae bacterium]|jgi:hypothetical protein
MTTCTLKARLARRLPDPVFDGAERHILLCSVLDIPQGLPVDESNVRIADTDKMIYRDVAKHLRNEEGTLNTFHLKNKGITVLADRLVKKGDDVYEIVFTEERQGIVDGGHTYKIINENQDRIRLHNSASDPQKQITQFVKVEVITGFSSDVSTEIAGGLNTALQVHPASLANHERMFDWIKAAVKGKTYEKAIAYKQNEDGAYSISDILRILELFNITLYPNQGNSYPIRAYTSKQNVLASYLKDQKPLKHLRPILNDILVLHDTISLTAPEKWNASGNKKAGLLAFVDHAQKGAHEFTFIDGAKSDSRLYSGALLPMLAAFRWMVINDEETGEARWRGSFDDVLTVWDKIATELMRTTKETSDDLGRSPEAVGKSANHWKTLYQQVAFYQAVTMAQS